MSLIVRYFAYTCLFIKMDTFEITLFTSGILCFGIGITAREILKISINDSKDISFRVSRYSSIIGVSFNKFAMLKLF